MEPLERWQDSYIPGYRRKPKNRVIPQPSTPASTQTHVALQPPHEDFRVLHLQPSTNFHDKLECSLQNVSFKEHPAYEAVSYVWGDQSDTVIIALNNKDVPITRNLAEALMHFRLPTEPRTLWVDALCIDQANFAERSQQVCLMRDIYSSCVVDLVWLGGADATRARGLDVASLLERGDIEYIRNQANKKSLQKKSNYSILHAEASKVLSRDDWLALRSVFETTSIWHRIWVMQEIACAPKVLLVLGGKTLNWDVIAGFLDSDNYPDAYHGPFHHNDYEAWINETFANIQVIEHQRKITRQTQTGKESKLLDVLARFRYTQATDPRDKIYGLLGLASNPIGVVPDYQKPVRNVYMEFFQTYVNETLDLDLLCQNPWGTHDGSAAGMDLPSWCPDFSKPKSTSLLFAQRSILCAGNKHCRTPCQVSPQGQLRLEGIILGQLPSICEKADAGTDTRGCATIPKNMPTELQTEDGGACPPLIYHHTGEDAFQAYWRTMMADCEIYPTRRLNDTSVNAYKTIFDRWRKDPEIFENWVALNYIKMLNKMGRGWKFAMTDCHRIYCMVPHAAQHGDVLAVVHGGKVPLVLRPSSTSEAKHPEYTVVGTAYAHGFMDGEAAKAVDNGMLEAVDLVLV